jgi:hypothetical protein
LTRGTRKEYVDNVRNSGRAGDLLQAVATAQAVAREADEALALAVASARKAGRTWAEIGSTLGTTRQAAFQRFGRPADPRTGAPMEPVFSHAGDQALALFGDIVAGRWAQACATFDETVAAKLDADRLAAVWAVLIGLIGCHERSGTPSVFQAGDYTVADVPLYFEAGERTGRVSYDRDGYVAGIFFLDAGGS